MPQANIHNGRLNVFARLQSAFDGQLLGCTETVYSAGPIQARGLGFSGCPQSSQSLPLHREQTRQPIPSLGIQRCLVNHLPQLRLDRWNQRMVWQALQNLGKRHQFGTSEPLTAGLLCQHLHRQSRVLLPLGHLGLKQSQATLCCSV